MVRSTLESAMALDTAGTGPALSALPTSHITTAPTTVATSAPPTASTPRATLPLPVLRRTFMPNRTPSAWPTMATNTNTATPMSSRWTESWAETSSPTLVAIHAPRSSPASSPR
jgi:hypothetical protein